MFGGASSYANQVDSVMLYIIGISIFLLVGITVAMIYFVIKYSRKRHPKAKQIEGNIALEVVWVVVPTIIVITMFWYGFKGFDALRMTSKTAMVVNVTGQMWKWKFKYENGKESDTLYLPLNKSVRLDLKSLDVNHAFYLPAFRIKEDVVASMITYMILKPDKLGRFDIACAEYCGLDHSRMYANLIVVNQKDFNAWVTSGLSRDAAPDSTQKALSPDSVKQITKQAAGI